MYVFSPKEYNSSKIWFIDLKVIDVSLPPFETIKKNQPTLTKKVTNVDVCESVWLTLGLLFYLSVDVDAKYQNNDVIVCDILKIWLFI